MSLELPGWVADAFNLIGLPWPGIDEDQLRGWATDVRAYSAEITDLASRSRSAVAAVAAHDESAFTRTLTSKWDHHHSVITGLCGPLEVFALALDVAADAVVAQKIVVIGAAVALAGEVIATQGEALLTFGLAEAEVPAEVPRATRPACRICRGGVTGTRWLDEDTLAVRIGTPGTAHRAPTPPGRRNRPADRLVGLTALIEGRP